MMIESLREQVKPYLRSMIMASYADQLDDNEFNRRIIEILSLIIERVRGTVLQAIVDEPEYPSDMPDELWRELDGNRVNVIQAMRSTVRLTKNGITDRFLQAIEGVIKR